MLGGPAQDSGLRIAEARASVGTDYGRIGEAIDVEIFVQAAAHGTSETDTSVAARVRGIEVGKVT